MAHNFIRPGINSKAKAKAHVMFYKVNKKGVDSCLNGEEKYWVFSSEILGLCGGLEKYQIF